MLLTNSVTVNPLEWTLLRYFSLIILQLLQGGLPRMWSEAAQRKLHPGIGFALRTICLAFSTSPKGGWGHHMPELGNHPHLEHPVSINLKVDSARGNAVVFAGNRTFRQIITALKRTGYISQDKTRMEVQVFDYLRKNWMYSIDFQDAILDIPLTEFEKSYQKGTILHLFWNNQGCTKYWHRFPMFVDFCIE